MDKFSHKTLDTLPKFILKSQIKDFDENIIKESNFIWNEKIKENPKLYNDNIISLNSFDKDIIHCDKIEFKLFVAQYSNIELRKAIRIKPLGVSAITLIDNFFVIGKRSSEVFMNPKHYENAPSGSIEEEVIDNDEINVTDQILKELYEELGFQREDILEIKPIYLAEDHQSNYADIYFKIIINPMCKEKLIINPEYDEILLLPKDQLSEHLKKKKYVPLSKYVLEIFLNAN